MVRQRRTTTLAKAGFDFGYLYDLSLFRFLSIRPQKGCLFLHAHVTAVSAVMVPGYGSYSTCSVLCGKLSDIGTMEPCCRRHFRQALSLCPQFQRIQSLFCSLIFILFSCCCYELSVCFTVSVHFITLFQYTISCPNFKTIYE